MSIREFEMMKQTKLRPRRILTVLYMRSDSMQKKSDCRWRCLLKLADHVHNSSVTLPPKCDTSVAVETKTVKAADPKATASPAAAAAEAAPAPAPAPVKEETPKAAKSTEATAESKPAAVTPAGEEVPPKRLEKRNSITLFFKNLSGKRPSTDAGATEAPAASAEKSK